MHSVSEVDSHYCFRYYCCKILTVFLLTILFSWIPFHLTLLFRGWTVSCSHGVYFPGLHVPASHSSELGPDHLVTAK